MVHSYMEAVHLFHINIGVRYSASEFGEYSFSFDIAQALRRLHTIRLDLKYFRHLLSNFATYILMVKNFDFVLGENDSFQLQGP